ncbi:MAG: ABC transporter permease [Roseiflexaceae bacterium]
MTPLTTSTEQLPQRLRRRAEASWQTLVSRQELIVWMLLMLVSSFLALRTETFLDSGNLSNIARTFSWIAIAAFGESLVIIIGGIDLSVGAVMALAGMICALAMQAGLPIPVAVVCGLLTGSTIGLINGLLVGRFNLQPFIVTLGTMSVARGVALSLTDGEPIRTLPAEFRALGQADPTPFGIPLPTIIMLITWGIMTLLLGRTVLGRYIFTLGSNSRALAMAGVDTPRVKVLVYTLCGLITSLAGLVMTARVGVAAPTAAIGYELDIIAAAVIGGISLFGGEGSMTGVMLGAALMQVLRNGLVLLGVPPQGHAIAIGAMILVVLLLDYWRRRRVTT